MTWCLIFEWCFTKIECIKVHHTFEYAEYDIDSTVCEIQNVAVTSEVDIIAIENILARLLKLQ